MTTNTLARSEKNGSTAPQAPKRDVVQFTPRFDIWETADELVLSGDLPGVTADDLDITFENDQLVLSGRVRQRSQGQKVVYTEYEVGDFRRSFTIDQSIDTSKISAEHSEGVLTVHLPKSEQVKPRRIEVKAK